MTKAWQKGNGKKLIDYVDCCLRDTLREVIVGCKRNEPFGAVKYRMQSLASDLHQRVNISTRHLKKNTTKYSFIVASNKQRVNQ